VSGARRQLLGLLALAAALLASVAGASAAPLPAGRGPAVSSSPSGRGPLRPSAPAVPRIAASAATVFESTSARPVYARDAGQQRLIASTTKLMTALVAVAALPLSRVCTAPPYSAGPLESQIGLRAGERMSVHDLLQALMLPSANDAAAALAVCAAGSRAAFVARMNAHARELGLRHTHFTTPIGLDDAGNHASAADLARLAIAARRVPFLRRTMDLPRALLRTGAHRRVVVNRNTLVLRVPWVNGVKTGHTSAAGYILVASGTQRGMTFVSVVLGDPSEATRDADALALLRWAFASYELAVPVRRGAVEARPSVRYRGDEHVDVVAARSVRLPLRRDARVRFEVRAPRELRGPMPRGTRVGTLVLHAEGRTLARIPLVTARAVPAVGPLERVARALAQPGSLLAIVAVLGGTAALLARRRGAARQRRRADMEAA
jgi:D-alanyl-D-alanine carboxypeptidase (penicillin-binding protein 5/6)